MGIDAAYAAAVVLLGYLVLGVTGFGSALVIVPLLALRWPLTQVVPLVLLMDVVASGLMGRLNLRQVAWPELRSLVPGMVLGCGLGLFLSRHLTSPWPLLFLGGYVVWVGWRTLGGPPPDTSPRPSLGGLYGLGVGVVQMSFGTAGPLVLAWLARRGVRPDAMRASTPVAMLGVALLVLIGMGWQGRLSDALLWQRLLVLLPLGLFAVVIGHRVAARLPKQRLRAAMALLLVASGLLLMVNAARQLMPD
ncbi:sulfite exporter TauE/SafE family protein [Hydrogenophaga sp.]|uniref:sulfite exporter TauE/SafE family protein n=1 Tax=Hydrogenophaga sp. TaxID=1904254 RepID=UPI002728107C|nr:sulfite exporter TauE/SafE family protein [Hydrogenophaga sp.]MDO8903626.1 sulfite exporter TauE/SafE family protein [Hydrogenophaga sp.]